MVIANRSLGTLLSQLTLADLKVMMPSGIFEQLQKDGSKLSEQALPWLIEALSKYMSERKTNVMS